MVRLEVNLQFTPDNLRHYFNSKMVRLEEAEPHKETMQQKEFQFQNGTIRSHVGRYV